MLFHDSAIAQMKTLSDDSLNHTCVISGAYSGACQVYDDEVQIRRMTGGDASFDAQALIRLPHQSHSNWTNKTFDQDSATVTATYEGIVQTGRIKAVMRKQAMCFVAVNWLDAAEGSDLGTISDLAVLDNGSGGVALTFTPATGATSHQAQVDGVDEGASVDGDTGIIVLSGLSSGEQDFTVIASDGTDETTSNEVTFEVS